MKRTMMVVGMMVSVAAACGGGAKGRETFTDPATPIEMARGAEFDIALKSNQSTGYQWVLVDSAALSPLRFVKKSYAIPREYRDNNGAGGTETWTFATPQPGQATIHLVYKGPGPDGPLADSARFSV
ncbi:MAG TPA: protease inhibitor I42 family protein, partial [Longimicrobium sp.]|nr:protease inhibitor I42 family protein [Longimicrobium sp.]